MVVKESGWNPRLETLLNVLDPVVGVSNIKRLIEDKRVFVHEVIYKDVSIGFYVCRVDVLINGDRELVIMHAVSDLKTHKPLEYILGVIFPGVGVQMKCNRVRIHSESRKMDDLLESAGFRFMESVFVKDI